MGYALETVLQQISNISCIEADANNLIIGTEDGQLLHYVINKDDPDSLALDFTYLLASRQEAVGRKAPQAILLLDCVQLAAVLANNVLSFYTLPELAPASGLRTLKDVQGLTQNANLGERIDADGSALLTIFTRKKVRQIKVSRQIVKLAKEVEYESCYAACQRGSIVCLATRASYDLIDLDRRARIPLFPVVQGETSPIGPQYAKFVPQIVSISSEEFLLVSGSPESTTAMGMFITLEGEITRGTLMFAAYPSKVVVEGNYIIALLPNNTIEVHDIRSQAVLQTISTQHTTYLTTTSEMIPVVSRKHLELIILQSSKSLSEQLSTLEKPTSFDLNTARSISDVLSQILVVDELGICALISETRLISINRMLNDGHIQEALSEAEQLARDTPPAYAERLYHELAYVHQKAGLLYFDQMLFDDAVDQFKQGNIDPRIILAKYPELNVESDDALLYSGLRTTVDNSPNVDEVISKTLSQTVDDQETFLKLSTIVKANATELLRRYLTAFREKKEFASTGTSQGSRSLFAIVDSTLLHILLNMDIEESAAKLKAFLNTRMEAPEAILDILTEQKAWLHLAQYKAKLSLHRDYLEIYQRLIMGEITDKTYKNDGLERMSEYLLEHGDDALIQEFGSFILRTDSTLGIQVFCHAIDAGIVSFSFGQILNDLRTENADVHIILRFLEHLILVRHHQDEGLKDELLQLYAKDVVHRLKTQEEVRTFIRSSINNYRSLALPKDPYLTFVAQLATSSSEGHVGEFMNLRNKLLGLLQGSLAYEANEILNIILLERDMLLAEQILLFGRLSKHSESLKLMVHDLKDFDSAEVYCYHGGVSLSQIRITSDKLETVNMRKKLFPLLYEEYLKLEDYSLQFSQSSQVLNRWGNYMDVAAILSIIPDHWSVEMISKFLISALAQLATEKRDAQIRRSLARGQLKHQESKTFVVVDGN